MKEAAPNREVVLGSNRKGDLPTEPCRPAVLVPKRTRFPNLARGQKPSPDEVDAVTATCRAELEAAGIKTHTFGVLLGRSEVPSKCMGEVGMWGFTRNWRYWVAEGPGLPPEYANALHETHGREVRVAGHCGCPSPAEWFDGFAVGSYHIDTVEGLKALADTLKSVRPRTEDSVGTDDRNAGGSETQ